MASSMPRGGPARVLLLMEQQPVMELVKLTLNHGLCITRETRESAEALTVIEEWDPHMAVIEVEIAGGAVFQQIERAYSGGHSRIPVLGLTRRGDLKTKLDAFDKGVDDIMTVPFSPEELLARALVIIRHAYGHTVPMTPVIKIGELEIDILNRLVKVGTTLLHLTGLEQSLLYFLAANAGKTVTRDQIMDAIWGIDFVADSNIVDRHIGNLRVKLQNGVREPRFISTVPGRGYRFIPVTDDSPPE